MTYPSDRFLHVGRLTTLIISTLTNALLWWMSNELVRSV